MNDKHEPLCYYLSTEELEDTLTGKNEGNQMDYKGIITIEPGKRGGKPCIRGMRITVYDVLEYLASGMTEEQILRDFPYLNRDDILAALSYAADRERTTLAIQR